MARIFDIDGPRELFAMLDHRFRDYCDDDEKADEDVVAIVVWVNHLREWIAPGYEPKKKNGQCVWPKADTPEKLLSQEVYDHPSFKVVLDICNALKHHDGALLRIVTETKYENEEPGIPSAHLVNGRPFEDYIEPVMAIYRRWFAQTTDREKPT